MHYRIRLEQVSKSPLSLLVESQVCLAIPCTYLNIWNSMRAKVRISECSSYYQRHILDSTLTSRTPRSAEVRQADNRSTRMDYSSGSDLQICGPEFGTSSISQLGSPPLIYFSNMAYPLSDVPITKISRYSSSGAFHELFAIYLKKFCYVQRPVMTVATY